MAQRGRPWGQKRVVEALSAVGQSYGYAVRKRSKDPKAHESLKKFAPDVVADPVRGSERRAFEVEATVNNNTIYKSLASPLQFLKTNGKAETYLVVPSAHKSFAVSSLEHMKSIIREFGKTARGANPKIRLSVITFDDVREAFAKLQRWESRDRRGRPPSCRWLPRAL